ncbi:MAG: TIGR01459 family HAD-type hydrolase, partial [Caulobacterales bacterium]|nr:TIGR01459 family HAD-type hydrolase [Caulobacterales bacterium]
AEIAADYDALLVDVWGVVHDGRQPFPLAIEACRRFRAERGPVALVSNSPRPGTRIPAQFDEIGVANDFYDAIVTSGDATHAELARRAPGPAFKLGPARDDHLYEGTGLAFAPLETAAFISCTGLFDDNIEGPGNYTGLLAAGKARDLDMVCANPDIHFRRGGRLVYAAGAIAEAYQQIGGRVILCGKPHPPIYARAFQALEQAVEAEVDRARVLAVGDGPATDLAGAAGQGIDALFVAGGIFADDAAAARGDGARIAAILSEHGAVAAYAGGDLRW